MDILRRTLKVYVISVICFIVLTMILAALIYFTGFKESWSFIGLVTVLSLTSLLTGMMEGNVIGKRGILVGIASSFVLMLIILLAAGGVFADTFGINDLSLFYVIPLIAGCIGGVMGTNLNK